MFVSAVQLNLKHCFSKKQFIDYIEKQVFENLLVMPDIICFPENINYCLNNNLQIQPKIPALNIV